MPTITGTAVKDWIHVLGDGNLPPDVSWNEIATATAGDDIINALGGDDTIFGGDGKDRIDGGEGADTMDGGLGADAFVNPNFDAGDVITEGELGGIDTIETNLRVFLSSAPYVERVILTGIGNISVQGNDRANLITGNAGNNILAGGAGNDQLYGRGGADTLRGGDGDDTYINPDFSAGDVIQELANGGFDTIQSDTSFVMPTLANVEALRLAGAANIDGTGNGGDNTITGNSGNNTLEGGGGNDTLNGGGGANILRGGAGDDTYMLPQPIDAIEELAGGGTDTIVSDRTFSLASLAEVENLTLTGASIIDGTGNGLANLIVGNAAQNKLFGGEGDDTLDGGGSSDTLEGGNGADTYRFATQGAGSDRIDGFTAIDRFDLHGGRFYAITDNGGAPRLFHAGGAVFINSTSSLTLDQWNALVLPGPAVSPNDWIHAAGDGNDPTGPGFNEIEYGSELTQPTDRITISVGAGDDVVFAPSNNNIIEGGEGADELHGGGGKDILNGGDDNDELYGDAGADKLNGGAGSDTLSGGDGGDQYLNVVLEGPDADIIIEGPGIGIDKITSAGNVSLAALPNIENVTLTGSANVEVVGNVANNVIIGNAGANRLIGGEGTDTLRGGGGNDTLIGGPGNDILYGDAGADTFRFATAATTNDSIFDFSTAEDRFDLGGGTFSGFAESGGSTTLTHAAGTILVSGVTGLSLDDWNDLVISGARAAHSADASHGAPHAARFAAFHNDAAHHAPIGHFGAADYLYA